MACVNVVGSTLSVVVWEAEKDNEMAEGADSKGWLDKPVKNNDQKISTNI